MTTPTQLQDLRKQLDHCMLRDRHHLLRHVRKIEQSLSRGQDVAGQWQRLTGQVAASVSLAKKRKQSVPPWSYPESLPVSARAEEIVTAIRDNQVVIIAGETGSGKTTQIPKLCMQAGLGQYGFIGHTQPRRLAARTVSQRIADELSSPLGEAVGFKIRFQDRVADTSIIKLMTDGILLAEINHDRFLSQYSAIIIDEAHERTLNIDFLLGYLKQLLPKRPDLKVVITSATIDHMRFASYFHNAPVIEVSGRTYPVELVYRPLDNVEETDEDTVADEESRMESGILQAVKDILQRQREQPKTLGCGDILVFLASERDIRQVADYLRRHVGSFLEIMPLYSRLSNAEQNRVFQSHSGRRIVLSTNVAETSVTVPGIGYVIDTGVARISRYSFRTKVQRLPIEPISQASANQRAGRCGRVAAGVCYRLYSEQDFLNRPEFTEAEVLRTNLSSVILQMQGLKLGELARFPFIDPPDQRLINDGYRLLDELGAVDRNRRITALGFDLLKFPVDPRIARMLVAANDLHCLQEVLVIASGMSVQEPWQRPHERQAAADESLNRFRQPDSDFLTFNQIWRECEEQKAALTNARYRKWLMTRFLSYLRMREWQDVYRQLKQACNQLGWTENKEGARYEEIHKAILTGLLSHIAVKDDQKGYMATRNRSLSIFPGSGLSRRKPKWIMCAEIVETQKVYGRTVAKIEPEWAEQIGAGLLKKSYFEPHWEKKRGSAIAYEQTSLFGLILTPRKAVNYAAIDPLLSRELFIQNALVAGDYETRAPYARHNQALINDLEYLEQKSRRRDILIDELSLYALFDQIVPAHIVNGKSFEKWRKKAEHENPRVLYLDRAQLLASNNDDVSELEFPDEVDVEGGKIEIDYQFEPGRNQDGLNILVPVTLINQIEDEKLEWLVPGLEKEKCIALIKSLPKTLRKHFVPAPDFADAFLATQPDRGRSLLLQLADYLRQRKAIDISITSWDENALPLHLRANLQVVNEQGELLREGRDIRQIKMELQGQFHQSLKLLTQSSIDQQHYDHWAFGDIPEVYELKQGSSVVKAYPALTDRQDGVSLELLDTQYAAELTMKKGILRLCLLALPKQVRYLKKQHGLAESAVIKYSAFGDKKSLTEGLVEASFFQAFVAHKPLPRTESDFKARLQSGNTLLASAATEMSDLIALILEQHHIVVTMLSGDSSPARVATKRDIEFQLSQLFPQNWLQNRGLDPLQQYPRYLEAIQVRWKRLQGKIERDRQLIDEIESLWEQYEERQQKHHKESVVDAALEEWRWALEEYRVSVFAQGVKTSYPVSYKRLQKMWQKVAL
ncbi:ATP-dependent RNA helicase HrpA [Ketobacter sp.]